MELLPGHVSVIPEPGTAVNRLCDYEQVGDVAFVRRLLSVWWSVQQKGRGLVEGMRDHAVVDLARLVNVSQVLSIAVWTEVRPRLRSEPQPIANLGTPHSQQTHTKTIFYKIIYLLQQIDRCTLVLCSPVQSAGNTVCIYSPFQNYRRVPRQKPLCQLLYHIKSVITLCINFPNWASVIQSFRNYIRVIVEWT